MKKVAGNVEEVGLMPGAQAPGAPPVSGPFSLIVRGARRLLRAAARTSAAGEAAGIGREKKPGSGAHRSEIDAGITGGLSLLAGGSPDGRRRA